MYAFLFHVKSMIKSSCFCARAWSSCLRSLAGVCFSGYRRDAKEAMSLLGEGWMNHVKGAPAENFTLKGWGTAADLDQTMT